MLSEEKERGWFEFGVIDPGHELLILRNEFAGKWRSTADSLKDVEYSKLSFFELVRFAYTDCAGDKVFLYQWSKHYKGDVDFAYREGLLKRVWTIFKAFSNAKKERLIYLYPCKTAPLMISEHEEDDALTIIISPYMIEKKNEKVG